MNSYNYCLIKQNKVYEDLYEILEEDELIMDNPGHKDKIKYKIEQLLKSYLTKTKIKMSENMNTNDEILEDLMVEITNNLDDEQGNTLLMYANNNFMYEVVFMEQLGSTKTDDDLNQLCSISNVELSPIYGKTAIIKSSYKDGSIKNSLINFDDVLDLFINNFYHRGVMLNPDGSMIELEFTGENPNLVIGGNFKMLTPLSLFGLSFIGYTDNGDLKNELASKIYGNEITGRLYLAILCPITNKKFWSISIDLLNDIIKLLNYCSGTTEQKKIIEDLEKELADDKLKNPFFLVKKYCV